MNSSHSDHAGAFPSIGPLTYLHLDADEVERALASAYPGMAVWYHATYEQAARSAALQGLLPSCWADGDCCCVFGYDRREDIPPQRGDSVLEIYSRALPGQLKSWWVPPQAICGAWHEGTFVSAAELRADAVPLLRPTGSCACELAAFTAEQVRLWRMVVS